MVQSLLNQKLFPPCVPLPHCFNPEQPRHRAGEASGAWCLFGIWSPLVPVFPCSPQSVLSHPWGRDLPFLPLPTPRNGQALLLPRDLSTTQAFKLTEVSLLLGRWTLILRAGKALGFKLITGESSTGMTLNLYHVEWLISSRMAGVCSIKGLPLGLLLHEQEGGCRSRRCPQYLLCFWSLGSWHRCQGKKCCLERSAREGWGYTGQFVSKGTTSNTRLCFSTGVFTTCSNAKVVCLPQSMIA